MTARPTPSVLRVVPHNGLEVEVAAEGPLTHRCPHVDEVDRGTVTVTWLAVTGTVELHSLAAYLTTWADVAASHEEIVWRIAVDVGALDGVVDVAVVAKWETAGLRVRVTR